MSDFGGRSSPPRLYAAASEAAARALGSLAESGVSSPRAAAALSEESARRDSSGSQDSLPDTPPHGRQDTTSAQTSASSSPARARAHDSTATAAPPAHLACCCIPPRTTAFSDIAAGGPRCAGPAAAARAEAVAAAVAEALAAAREPPPSSAGGVGERGSVVVVHGPSESGKSEAVIEACHRTVASWPATVFWIDASAYAEAPELAGGGKADQRGASSSSEDDVGVGKGGKLRDQRRSRSSSSSSQPAHLALSTALERLVERIAHPRRRARRSAHLDIVVADGAGMAMLRPFLVLDALPPGTVLVATTRDDEAAVRLATEDVRAVSLIRAEALQGRERRNAVEAILGAVASSPRMHVSEEDLLEILGETAAASAAASTALSSPRADPPADPPPQSAIRALADAAGESLRAVTLLKLHMVGSGASADDVLRAVPRSPRALCSETLSGEHAGDGVSPRGAAEVLRGSLRTSDASADDLLERLALLPPTLLPAALVFEIALPYRMLPQESSASGDGSGLGGVPSAADALHADGSIETLVRRGLLVPVPAAAGAMGDAGANASDLQPDDDGGADSVHHTDDEAWLSDALGALDPNAHGGPASPRLARRLSAARGAYDESSAVGCYAVQRDVRAGVLAALSWESRVRVARVVLAGMQRMLLARPAPAMRVRLAALASSLCAALACAARRYGALAREAGGGGGVADRSVSEVALGSSKLYADAAAVLADAGDGVAALSQAARVLGALGLPTADLFPLRLYTARTLLREGALRAAHQQLLWVSRHAEQLPRLLRAHYYCAAAEYMAARGEIIRARRRFLRAFSFAEDEYNDGGPSDVVVAALTGAGACSLALGCADDALLHLKTALSVVRQDHGTESAAAIGVLALLAQAYRLLEKRSVAEQLARWALRVTDAAARPSSPGNLYDAAPRATTASGARMQHASPLIPRTAVTPDTGDRSRNTATTDESATGGSTLPAPHPASGEHLPARRPTPVDVGHSPLRRRSPAPLGAPSASRGAAVSEVADVSVEADLRVTLLGCAHARLPRSEVAVLAPLLALAAHASTSEHRLSLWDAQRRLRLLARLTTACIACGRVSHARELGARLDRLARASTAHTTARVAALCALAELYAFLGDEAGALATADALVAAERALFGWSRAAADADGPVSPHGRGSDSDANDSSPQRGGKQPVSVVTDDGSLIPAPSVRLDILRACASLFLVTKQPERAAATCRSAFQITLELYPDGHLTTAEILAVYGSIELRIGAFEAGVRSLQLARDAFLSSVRRGECTEWSGERWIVLRAEATVCAAREKLADAATLLRSAVQCLETSYGPHSVHLASVSLDLGTALAQIGELDDARRALHRAIVIFGDIHGPRHRVVGKTLHNLAGVYRLLGNQHMHRKLLRDALLVEEEIYGKHHPETLDTTRALAIAYEEAGRARRAAYYKRRTRRAMAVVAAIERGEDVNALVLRSPRESPLDGLAEPQRGADRLESSDEDDCNSDGET